MMLAVAAAGTAVHVGSSLMTNRLVAQLSSGALLLLLAALCYVYHQRRRLYAESEDRRLVEGQLGDDRYWGTVALLALSSRQVQALHEPLLATAISPAEIAHLIHERSLSGMLHIVERSLLESDADGLLTWLQQRASWLHKIPPPLGMQWNRQTVVFILVGKGSLPARLSVEELSLHLTSCVGAAVILREKRKSHAMDEPLVQAGYRILGICGFLLAMATAGLLLFSGPEPPSAPPLPQKPKDMATLADAATSEDGATKPSDAGEPTDGGKHRTGIDAGKVPSSGAKHIDKGAQFGGKKDKKEDKSGQGEKDNKGNKKERGLVAPAVFGGAGPQVPQQLKSSSVPGGPSPSPTNVDAGTPHGGR